VRWKTNSWSAHDTRGDITRHRGDGYDYAEGVVSTPHGYVRVYAQGGERSTPHTRMWFIWRGREQARGAPRRLSVVGLASVAARFAREIAEGEG